MYVDRTDSEILRRRQIVVEHMKDNYTLPRGGNIKATAAVKQAKCRGANKMNIGADTVLYRLAFRYLNGNEEERKKIDSQIEKRVPGTGAIRLLLASSITTWAEVMRLVQEKEKPIQPGPEGEKEEDNLKRLDGAVKELRNTVNSLLAERAQQFVVERENLLQIVKRLEEENSSLREALAKTQRLLEERTVREIEVLAQSLPLFPAVFSVIQEVKATMKARHTKVPEGFPRVCRSCSGVPFEYTEQFLKQFYSLQEGEQKQVAKALRHLDEQGFGHMALRSQKFHQSLPGVPAEAWWSRASDELRFVWDRVLKNGETKAVRVYGVFRKGDTRLSQSEG